MSEYKDLCKWLREHSSGFYRKSAEAAEVIEKLEAERDALRAEIEQLKNPWISVEDRLPEGDYFLIANFRNKPVFQAVAWNFKTHNKSGKFIKYTGGEILHINNVTHWMPLPKLEGKGDE